MSLDRVVFQSSCGECLGFDECSLRHVEGNEADMGRVVAVPRRGLSPPVVLSNQACDDSNTLHPRSVSTFSSLLRNTLVTSLARSSILNFLTAHALTTRRFRFSVGAREAPQRAHIQRTMFCLRSWIPVLFFLYVCECDSCVDCQC